MNSPLVIGITGGSGSGKTTFIKLLREPFLEADVCVVSQDDYYKPRSAQKKDDQGIHNFDLPGSINKKTFLLDVEKLLAGQTVERPEYTFNNENAEPKMHVFRPAPVIIVEGLFVFHYKKINALLDLRIFLHAKENLKVIRRIRRDQMERNYPIDDVLYRYEHHVMPTFEKYVQPHIEHADLVINNNKDFNMGLAVVQGYIKNFLSEYPR
ncbi:uridine kinase family protein [Haliscomenobacter hydrossis]|uniref:Uridine kinase n=1 Tax=Haliscomenobacter hydrossis (strain ATCC 27775 / DSM 1100 / LMG 10767 / O) TaxID=760192 RepID=F4L098_HALH1|nr:uridine kinase [Haliscomenobacter hydrossis]AEE53771.1 Uridine kinase [Haliscomenobacter hydrossis DSM 1100]